LKNLLDTSSDRQFAVEINDVTSTIASVGPRAQSFNVDFARPEEDDGNDGLLDEVIYDIISFFGIPTETRLMSSLRALRSEYGIAKPWQPCSAPWLDMSRKRFLRL
jgi:hypothetical protein